MSRKVKKQASSMSFSINRWFRRISTSKPSASTFTLIVIAFSTFLFGGGLLTIIEHPLIAYYNGSTFLFLYPTLDGQFVMDTFFSSMSYVLGLAGLLLMYRSTKNAYKPRQAYMTLIIGVALVLMAYLFLEGSILTKIRGL
jgi:uncharacterized membrane protein